MTAHRAGALLAALSLAAAACGGGRGQAVQEIQRARAGRLEVVLLSPTGALHHGKDRFVVEFRSASGGGLVDVGAVKGSAVMSMSGAPMLGSLEVRPTGVPGRYEVESDLSMAGTWRTIFEWSGPAGSGSVALSGPVQ